MAIVGSTYLNLIDALKSDENTKLNGMVLEMLRKSNPILDDAMAIECNSGTTHKHSIRTGLPTPIWGRLYQGVPQSKSHTQAVEDTTGFLEAASGVDERLLKITKNPAALRLSEASAHLEAMNNEMATGIFYHDVATTPEKFKGLAARFSTLGTSGAANQIIDCGGTGSDNTSLWMVTWGDNQCHLLYPEGTQAGIAREDMGRQRVIDPVNGGAYYIKEEMFRWHVGLAVKDWRYVVRLANIDVSDLKAGNVDLYKYLRQGYYRHWGRRSKEGMTAIYCNADVLEALDAMQTNGGATDNYTRLRYREIEGAEVLTYRGFPLRDSDAILNTEARVV